MAAAVGLDPPVPGLASASRNATAAGPAGPAAGTRALILLSCLLLLVWSHAEKKRVPGGLQRVWIDSPLLLGELTHLSRRSLVLSGLGPAPDLREVHLDRHRHRQQLLQQEVRRHREGLAERRGDPHHQQVGSVRRQLQEPVLIPEL